MGAGRGRSTCALWGGISLGVGTLAFALFSPASVGCSTNLILLTHGTVTARGCAAYSVVSRIGVGLIVLGAVLLLGSFALTLRTWRQAAAVAPVAPVNPEPTVNDVLGDFGRPAPEVAVAPSEPQPRPATPQESQPPPIPLQPSHEEPPPAEHWAEPLRPRPEPAVARARPIAPGEQEWGDEASGDDALSRSAVQLPPGWYGNPNNPDHPVQWWDGAKLVDRRD